MSTLLSIIYALIIITHSKSSRDEEFSRINHYELVHIDSTLFESRRIIQFTAFNHHYNIQLIPNHDMAASNIRHTSFDPTKQYTTSNTHSCHYFGTLLDTHTPSTIALSLCNNRGIRGRITAFNNTILIKPSAYYLNHKHSARNAYTLSDQVLIYRLSDFNTTNIGRAAAIDGDPHRIHKQLIKTVDTKRRLYSASSPAKTEVLVVNGPLRTLRYQTDYGSSWYDVLLSDLLDVFNQVSATYLDTNWGSTVGGTGSISVQMVELEIIFAFTGPYATLAPNYYYANCQTSYSECNINGRDWLSTFRQWIYFNKDVSTFDEAQLISDMEFSPQTSGWGNIGVVCTGSSSVADVYEGWGLDFLARTITHEMGHNFGMSHDGQSGDGEDCNVNDGLMGYGNGEGFSACSIQSLQNYFTSQNSLTCLNTGYRAFSSNHDDDGGDIGTETTTTTTAPPVTTPTSRPTSRPTTSTNNGNNGDWDCLGMRNIESANFNGYWENAGTNDGKTAYTLNGFFLYYFEVYNWWLISSAIGSLSDLKGYCMDIDNIAACSSQLKVFGSDGWIDEYSAEFYDCTDSGSGSTDTGDTIDFVCTYFDRLVIRGMTEDKYGASYDGEWYPSGCHNEESYYTKDGDTSRYLCKSSDYNLWIMSDELCGRSVLAYSPQSNGAIMGTQNNWNVLSASGWITDTDVMITPDQAFTDEDLSCLLNNSYNDNLCVYSNDTLWNGERTFVLNTKSCRNGEAIYQYIEYDENGEEDAFGNSNDDIKAIYHLHFHEELRYSDGNETIGEWMISKDQISIDALAFCEKDNLLECTRRSWIVDDYSLNEHSKFDGLLQKVIDEYMMINNGECHSIKDEKNKAINLDVLIYIVGGIVVFVGVIICSVWCYRQNKAIKDDRKRVSHMVVKNVNVESDDDDDDQEEVEVNVEVGLTTMY